MSRTRSPHSTDTKFVQDYQFVCAGCDLRVEEFCYAPPPVAFVYGLGVAEVVDWAEIVGLRLVWVILLSE